MSGYATFDCEGCGLTVHAVGRIKPPEHRMCAVCEWIDAHIPPEHAMDMRRRCEPGGWESERERRGVP